VELSGHCSCGARQALAPRIAQLVGDGSANVATRCVWQLFTHQLKHFARTVAAFLPNCRLGPNPFLGFGDDVDQFLAR
jgi:hypothetical protein